MFTEVKPCWTGLLSGWVTIWIKYPVLYFLGSQASVVNINHAFHLYYKCCMRIEFQSISTWLRGFPPGTPVSFLLKIDFQSNPSDCGAVLRGHTWIVFRARASSRQHNSFGPTSLSCALRNSVYDCTKRAITKSDSWLLLSFAFILNLMFSFFLSLVLLFFPFVPLKVFTWPFRYFFLFLVHNLELRT